MVCGLLAKEPGLVSKYTQLDMVKALLFPIDGLEITILSCALPQPPLELTWNW